ncbi:hypothetical protein Ddye_008018 [Dipteronia dyeriana]|uniref:acylphosphatase n=1 Tax=Dipteronia dyeriana TaxID=168575 RepID=A0AAD9X942_9ROSI|nr:hypothetical protein Ddye_008018 [Dipteronia dyeriana]
MASSTIPQQQQLLTRFLTYGSIKIRCINDATNTNRLTNLITSHSHSVHRPPSLRRRFTLSIASLPFLLRPRSSSLRHFLSSMTTPQASANPPQSTSTKTVRVVIKGRVQGVFYRIWTTENATQLGLKGWVRNRRDGSVEALFSGNPGSVQDMEQRCRRGPRDAMVTGLEVFPCNDDPGTGFTCKQTA